MAFLGKPHYYLIGKKNQCENFHTRTKRDWIYTEGIQVTFGIEKKRHGSIADPESKDLAWHMCMS